MIKILVPIDGSKTSMKALQNGIDYGYFDDREIHLITVVKDAQAAGIFAPNVRYVEEVLTAGKAHATQVLEDAKRFLKSKGYKSSTISRVGDPANEILDYAKAISADMIVMGNRGLGAFSKTLLGSVSSKVIAHAKCSVLIIKHN